MLKDEMKSLNILFFLLTAVRLNMNCEEYFKKNKNINIIKLWEVIYSEFLSNIKL